MRFPSKVTRYGESIISKFPMVLSALESQDMTATALYRKVKRIVGDVGEFIEILDCLYAMNMIEFTDMKDLHYVG